MVDLISQSCFFVRVAIGLGIGEMVDLTIGGAISIGTDIAVSFSGLSLW